MSIELTKKDGKFIKWKKVTLTLEINKPNSSPLANKITGRHYYNVEYNRHNRKLTKNKNLNVKAININKLFF